MKATPDLVVVGAACRDLVQDHDRGWRLGGSAPYAALTALGLGLTVGCVLGVDADVAASPELARLKDSGVDLVAHPLEHGPVFSNIEHEGRRVQRWASLSDRIPISIPDHWRSAPCWLLAPVAGELDEGWAEVAGSEAIVGIGWQGLLREFRRDHTVSPMAPGPSRLLARAHVVVASVHDFSPALALAEVRRCLGDRPLLILTAGAGGGIALDGAALRRFPAIPSPAMVDSTGAGDAFLAAFVSSYLLFGRAWTLQRALSLSAATSSCAVEGAGLDGVPTRAQVAGRLAIATSSSTPPAQPGPGVPSMTARHVTHPLRGQDG